VETDEIEAGGRPVHAGGKVSRGKRRACAKGGSRREQEEADGK
jgi:hypothetical protein